MLFCALQTAPQHTAPSVRAIILLYNVRLYPVTEDPPLLTRRSAGGWSERVLQEASTVSGKVRDLATCTVSSYTLLKLNSKAARPWRTKRKTIRETDEKPSPARGWQPGEHVDRLWRRPSGGRGQDTRSP